MYVISGSTLFVVYVVLSIRLMWAGGELQNIEMVWYNLFDCRGDSKKRMPYKHTLTVAKNEHAMGTVAIKPVAVLATTFLGTMHPAVVATVRVFLCFVLSLCLSQSLGDSVTNLARVHRSWLSSEECCWV